MSIATSAPSAPTGAPLRSPRRGIAVTAITALLVGGLVALPATAATAEIPLPPDAVAFLVSPTDSGRSGRALAHAGRPARRLHLDGADLVAGDTTASPTSSSPRRRTGPSDPSRRRRPS